MVFLPQTLLGTWPNIANARAAGDTDYQVIGDQVLRLEVSYWAKRYNNSPNLSGVPYDSTYPSPSPMPSPSPPPHNAISGMQDVLAVVVSLAVLDTRTRSITTTSGLDTIISSLADVPPATGAVSPATTWRNAIEGGTIPLPKAVTSQIRVYERFLPTGTLTQ